MEFLSSRVIVRPRDPEASIAFYRDALGLAVFREFPGGTVFFAGNGLLEVSGRGRASRSGCRYEICPPRRVSCRNGMSR